jgi:hypothetical protein
MPEKRTRERAAKKKSASSKAGEYVREEMEHIREGKHGARSPEQAIAIGLSKARRAGVKIPPRPGAKKTEKPTHRKPSAKRSRATEGALKREGRQAASHEALSEHSRKVARRRGHADMQRSAQKAARTRASEKGSLAKAQSRKGSLRTPALKAQT